MSSPWPAHAGCIGRRLRVPRAIGTHVMAPARTACSSTAVNSYEPYLTARSLARQPSAIRALQPLLSIPGMISLGGGMPNPDTFPFESMSVTVKDGSSLQLQGKELFAALQYGPTSGHPALLRHLENLQRTVHGNAQPSTAKICITTGSQDALSKAFDMLLEGPQDALLVEAQTYSGSLAYLQPIGCGLVPVACDGGGLLPGDLRKTLSEWDSSTRGRRPRVLYTIPTGSNPTGATLSLARRTELYAVAQEFDLLILEDDPYYYMQFGERVSSLMSMDVDGRVLRFDSLSKLLSSGMRLGFATGPPALIERIELHSQASTLHSSSLSQALVAKLFDRWQEQYEGAASAGFLSHCRAVADFYQERRDSFNVSAERHLAGLAEWTLPEAGMFVWLRLLGIEDTDEFINTGARDAKVLLVPGRSFDPSGAPSPFVRAAFSTASAEEMDIALSRLGKLLRERQMK